MYSLIIIDDERFILDQLSDLFDWKSLGFSLSGCFTGVKNALEFVRNNHTDVILTDIRLGRDSGLNLAKEALAIDRRIRIVLISAYSEFDYAREAVALHAFDYLLKPVTYDSVTSCFSRLKQVLDQATDEDGSVAELAGQVARHVRLGENSVAWQLIENTAHSRHMDFAELQSFIKEILQNIMQDDSVRPNAKMLRHFLQKLEGCETTDDLLYLTSKQMHLLYSAAVGVDNNLFFVETAKQYIDEHIHEFLTLEKVSAQVSLSPNYFSRYFKKHTGVKFVDYLNLVRMKKAIELLKDPAVRIGTIHRKIGYRSRGCFYSVFYKETGHTPSEYRRMVLQPGESPEGDAAEEESTQ